MNERILSPEWCTAFEKYLRTEERCAGTIEKYLRDLRRLCAWTNGQPVSRARVAAWRDGLTAQGYAPCTVNSMLAAVNTFFKFADWPECRVKFLKVQRRLFRDRARELSPAEYRRLVDTAARDGKERLALLLETMGATGIRVSETAYITVEAARDGRAEISLKGKIRTILLPARLCRKLKKYARKNKIASGAIFRTRSGKGLSRKQIWAEMKRLCRKAGVSAAKVFPHNLRHLFAAVFYRASKDIVSLADVLGHTSVETTRIYLLSSGAEYARRLNRLGLIS